MRKNIILIWMIVLGTFIAVADKNPVVATAKKKNGWIELFDGKSLRGWRGYNQDDMPGVWTVDKGAIKIISKRTPEATDRGDIIFDRKFKNFILEFEFCVSKGANCGVFYLVTEHKGERIFQSAPEYQILDNANHPDAMKGQNGNRRSASLYDMIPATPQNAKPYGKWNKGKIVVNDGLVLHYQNGKKVVEYRLWTPEWQIMVTGSKFNQWPGFLTPGGGNHEGYIGLQDHGDDVWFRNIRVQELK